MQKHTIIITIPNQITILTRIIGLLCSKGCNVKNIIGAPTENPDIYKLHLEIHGSKPRVELIIKQLNNLADTLKVVDISHNTNYISRELLLVKVNDINKSSEIFQLINTFKAKLVDITRTDITIDLTGSSSKIDRFIDLLKPYGIKEFVRSGKLALKGNQ